MYIDSLTYNKDFVEVKGSDNSTTIPVSAISAVFVKTKGSSIWLLILAIIFVIIGSIIFLPNFSDDGLTGISIMGMGLASMGVILGIIFFAVGNEVVYGIRSDGCEYTVIDKESVGKVAKEELSKIVIEGRRQCQQIKE